MHVCPQANAHGNSVKTTDRRKDEREKGQHAALSELYRRGYER